MHLKMLLEKKKSFIDILVCQSKHGFLLAVPPNGAGLNGVAAEKLVEPNIDVAVANFRLA